MAPTKQTEDSPKEYKLTAGERQTLLDLSLAAGQRKLNIYNLNMQLEREQKERDAAEALFAGALAMLTNAHGMPGAQLAPDFTTITKEPTK